jgi:cyclopropane-fatty-acyl-phospholipid synthase
MWYDKLIANSLIPEFIIRFIVRLHFKYRLLKQTKKIEDIQEYMNNFMEEMKTQLIAINSEEANIQHYEVITEFFQHILGKNMKYSCGYWEDSIRKRNLYKKIDQSEEKMLRLTCERADIQDHDEILDLGCGWGSLSIYLATNYPKCKITALSNSSSQKEYIELQIARRNITNLNIIKADIINFQTDKKFDKIVSIEMFEHMRNYELLLEKLSTFLIPNGLLFIHIFTDNSIPYYFELNNKSKWMAEYFFRGGMMPSADLLFYFSKDFFIKKVWRVNGTHYYKTLEAWLQKMKREKKKIKEIFREFYGKSNVKKWWNYWKIFFISCSEAFKYNNGNQRFVSHYLLQKR